MIYRLQKFFGPAKNHLKLTCVHHISKPQRFIQSVYISLHVFWQTGKPSWHPVVSVYFARNRLIGQSSGSSQALFEEFNNYWYQIWTFSTHLIDVINSKSDVIRPVTGKPIHIIHNVATVYVNLLPKFRTYIVHSNVSMIFTANEWYVNCVTCDQTTQMSLREVANLPSLYCVWLVVEPWYDSLCSFSIILYHSRHLQSNNLSHTSLE